MRCSSAAYCWDPLACRLQQFAAPGRVIGHLDSVAYDGKQEFISGWACQHGQKESIPIHIYANPTTADPTKSKFLSVGDAVHHANAMHEEFAFLPISERQRKSRRVH